MHDVTWMPCLWFPVEIGFCPNEDAWKKEMQKRDMAEPYPERTKRGATFTTFVKYNETPFGLLTISDHAEDDDPSQVIGLILHECVHAFQFLCNEIGEQKASSEFEAYGIQQIYLFMEGAYSEMRWDVKHGKKNKTSKGDRGTASSRLPRDRNRVPRKRRLDQD